MGIVFESELPRQQEIVGCPRFFVAPYSGKRGRADLRCATKLDGKEIPEPISGGWSLVARSKTEPRTKTRK